MNKLMVLLAAYAAGVFATPFLVGLMSGESWRKWSLGDELTQTVVLVFWPVAWLVYLSVWWFGWASDLGVGVRDWLDGMKGRTCARCADALARMERCGR